MERITEFDNRFLVFYLTPPKNPTIFSDWVVQNVEIETYSEGNKAIIDGYLENESLDGINIYDYEGDRDYLDSEFIGSRTDIKMKK